MAARDEYDLAYGPGNPRRRIRRDEWEDPFAWVDLLVSAPAQLRSNLAANRD